MDRIVRPTLQVNFLTIIQMVKGLDITVKTRSFIQNYTDLLSFTAKRHIIFNVSFPKYFTKREQIFRLILNGGCFESR